jgi:putative intracellular protease/amidase
VPKLSALPRTQRIGILVFDDFEPLDVWGFVEAFSIARFAGCGYAAPPPHPFEIVLISNQASDGASGSRPQPVRSYNGPRVVPDWFCDQALCQELDLLMIPGGAGVGALLSTEHSATFRALVDWVRAMDAHVPLLSSVCTGAAVLASAGVLDGHPATTNHEAFAWVGRFGPRVLWDDESRWVDAGRYVTSAGVSAGTDMGFYLVARLAGPQVADAAARAAEYDWRRDPQRPIVYPQQAGV